MDTATEAKPSMEMPETSTADKILSDAAGPIETAKIILRDGLMTESILESLMQAMALCSASKGFELALRMIDLERAAKPE